MHAGDRVTVQNFSNYWNGQRGTIIELREVRWFWARKPGALVRMDGSGIEWNLTLNEIRPE